MGEVEGLRRLPIVIGMFEAQAIAIEIEKIIPNRPMTHDLFKSFSDSFQFEIEKIVISEMKEGVFYAKIHSKSETAVVEIDSRPSDAIAIALRTASNILADSDLLDKVGIDIPERLLEGQSAESEGGGTDVEMERFREFLDQINPEDFAG